MRSDVVFKCPRSVSLSIDCHICRGLQLWLSMVSRQKSDLFYRTSARYDRSSARAASTSSECCIALRSSRRHRRRAARQSSSCHRSDDGRYRLVTDLSGTRRSAMALISLSYSAVSYSTSSSQESLTMLLTAVLLGMLRRRVAMADRSR
jgi:hypothetical protein